MPQESLKGRQTGVSQGRGRWGSVHVKCLENAKLEDRSVVAKGRAWGRVWPAELFHLSTIDILDQTLLCCKESHALQDVNSTSGLYPLRASSTSLPSCDSQKRLQTWPPVPRGAESPLLLTQASFWGAGIAWHPN